MNKVRLETVRWTMAAALCAGCAGQSSRLETEAPMPTSLAPASGSERPPEVVVIQTGERGSTQQLETQLQSQSQRTGPSTGDQWHEPTNPGVDTRDPLSTGELRFARGVTMGTSAQTAGGFYGEELNPDSQFDGNCGGTSLAIMYVPAANFTLRSIAVHASVATLGILDDADGRPGAMLATARTQPSHDAAWFEATLEQPVALRAGNRYWLFKSEGGCSRAASGSTPLYFGLFQTTNGPRWEGPYRWHPFMARLYGRAQ
jgi:hypothetical protein